MKARRYALCLFIAGLLATGYLYWSFHRISNVALGHGQSWPYPDPWLARWEQRLDAAHPASPGTIKLEGEFPRMEFYLEIWLGVAAVATLGCLAWAMSSQRRRHA